MNRVTLKFSRNAARPRWEELSPGIRAALDGLEPPGTPEADLEDLVRRLDGPDALPLWYYGLGVLGGRGALSYCVEDDGTPIAIVTPMVGGLLARPHVAKDARLRLSRFAYYRRDEDELVLEAAVSPARVVLLDRRTVNVLCSLIAPCTVEEVAAQASLGTFGLRAFLSFLLGASLVDRVDDSGMIREDRDVSLRHWEFHDLLFHSRSRLGTHNYPVGGTFPQAANATPLPAVKPVATAEPTPLPRPRTDSPVGEMSLADVLKHRRSLRKNGTRPLGVAELGEFLFYAARASHPRETSAAEVPAYEITLRPSPSGGACHALEVYVVSNECEGVRRGIYHYNPVEHVLYRIESPDMMVDALLRDARVAADRSEPPQLLFVVTSRFRRLSWKYSGIAYATGLKDLGALMQTMYLVATAMGLSPCALGSGDSRLFAQAVGTSWSEESSIGEFMLGSGEEAVGAL